VPYHPGLSQRLQEMLAERAGFQPKKMFGGIGWLLNGHMCVGVYKSWLIVRVGEPAAVRLLREAHVEPMDITGKPMKGWARISNQGLAEDHRLQRYVELAIEFVSRLPAKTSEEQSEGATCP
jgi:TfoX/Sxy family transcriptional regulator of competence genes